MIRYLQQVEVEAIIKKSPEGRNTNFLKSSHNLWIRFQNYEKALPMGYVENHKVVAIIFATYNRNQYCNLYEIVTLQGQEGNHYASKLWDVFIKYAVDVKGMTRLKMSCTPTSITWHNRNGLIYWGVDVTGSLRSDQPMFATRKDQLIARESYIENPINALPEARATRFLIGEDLEKHNFGPRKTGIVKKAIEDAGKNWLRDHLLELTK